MDLSGMIVVGYDGSAQAARAVRWSAKLAEAAERELRIVHAWVWPLITKDLGPIDGVAESGHRNTAERLLREAVADAEDAAPDVRVSTSLITGSPRPVLEYVSKTAHLLVLGHRGMGGFLGMLLGSVTLGMIAHAGCPVAVIHDEDTPRGPVLVGVDRSRNASEAVDMAARLATALDAPLKVVHVRRMLDDHTGQDEVEATRILEENLQHAREKAPAVEVTGQVVHEHSPVRGLLAEAAGTGLLVMGHQGESKRRFGSVAHALVHHAPCSTVICRHRYEPDGDASTVLEVEDRPENQELA